MTAVRAIETEGLTKRFGAFTAVDDLTLHVREGEVFGLLGSNGAGKSTAIRMLCGLMKPTSGTARVLGIDVVRDPESVKTRIGYMTQKFSLYQDLTVGQNLEFFGGVYGLDRTTRRERARRALRLAGLEGREDDATASLPGGWKQSLALACALLHEPRLVFLDEPTGGVDPLSRRKFWDRIGGLAAEGVTVLVTTHYLDEAEHCHRIALMHAGRMVAEGTISELKSVFAGREVYEVACARPIAALDVLDGEPWALEVTLFGDRLHVVVEGSVGGGRAVAALERAGLGPARAERIVPSLEDVFIHSIESEERSRRAARGAS